MNILLTKFVVGCNIPFSLVNVDYAQKLPSRKVLSGKMLDKLYEDVLEKSKSDIQEDLVLVADSWKHFSGKTMNFTLITHNTDLRRSLSYQEQTCPGWFKF